MPKLINVLKVEQWVLHVFQKPFKTDDLYAVRSSILNEIHFFF